MICNITAVELKATSLLSQCESEFVSLGERGPVDGAVYWQ